MSGRGSKLRCANFIRGREFRHENLVLSQHMRQVGNIKSNEIYNPDEVRHPPPANTIDVARDSEIEKFIRGT
jgi:hypothetical protein